MRAGALDKASRPYHNSFQGLKVVFQAEGIRGIQRGLSVAYLYQVCLNGTRLGLYEPLRAGIVDLFGLHSDHSRLAASITAGAVCGAGGAALGSPLFLIKTQRQSYSPVFTQIGHQHQMDWTWRALADIWKAEGVKGLYRGADAAMARAGVGSAVQMPTYMIGKEILIDPFHFKDTIGTHFGISMFTGLMVCLAMNPFECRVHSNV